MDDVVCDYIWMGDCGVGDEWIGVLDGVRVRDVRVFFERKARGLGNVRKGF